LIEAIDIKSCWLYAQAKSDIVALFGLQNDVSSKIIFARGFDDKPGSKVMSFNLHVLNLSILTARKHMDLAIWLIAQHEW